jgi:regulator of RNase E activity RraB
MGLFDKLAGKQKRFISEQAFEAEFDRQTAMTPKTMEQLRSQGVGPEKPLKLEFFFYTDAPEKAAALAADLTQRGYAVKVGAAAANPKLQFITGWTSPIVMADDVVLAWTKEMCAVGFTHDCEFDGWGTNP